MIRPLVTVAVILFSAAAFADESMNFTVSYLGQNCKRKEASSPFVCITEVQGGDKIVVSLAPAAKKSGEDEAFEGSAETGFAHGAFGQYLATTNVRKSVSFQGRMEEYRVSLTVRKWTPDDSSPVYQSEYVYSSGHRPNSTIVLPTDRDQPSANFYQEVVFFLEN